MSRQGEIRKAAKLIEKAWPRCQHPDIARAYLDVRPGDSTGDRLERAKTLMGIASFDPVSRMTVARAALAAKDFAAARKALLPLVGPGQRPSVRTCLLMAELEEAEHGDTGLWREWLARSSRASLDPAWIADGKVYDHWAPVSQTTGKLDAFHWQVPAERLGQAMDALPAPMPKPDTLPSQVTPALSHAAAEAADPAEDRDERGAPDGSGPMPTFPAASEPVSGKAIASKAVTPIAAASPPSVTPDASKPPLIEGSAIEPSSNGIDASGMPYREDHASDAGDTTTQVTDHPVVEPVVPALERPVTKASRHPARLSSG